MTEITDLTFEKEVIEASKKTAVIVDFYAPWCGPCLKLKPIIEKLSREYTGEIKIISLNIEENLEKASEYSILSIPSVKMFKNGKVTGEFLGFKPEREIREWIEENT